MVLHEIGSVQHAADVTDEVIATGAEQTSGIEQTNLIIESYGLASARSGKRAALTARPPLSPVPACFLATLPPSLQKLATLPGAAFNQLLQRSMA
jgi:hypothetical protein